MKGVFPSRKSRVTAFLLSLCFLLFSLAGCFLLEIPFGGGSAEKRTLKDFQFISYSRPDFDSVSEEIDSMLSLLATQEGSADLLLRALDRIVSSYYYDFSTMRNLAFVNYARDMTSEELRDEYYFVSEQMTLLSMQMEELFYACAASSHRDLFEERLMGEGFFDGYEGDYTVPKELEVLYQRETALVRQYSEAMLALSVTYEGVTYTSETVQNIEDPILYEAVCEAYYAEANARLGEIFVELVKVRQKIASYYGTDAYSTFAFLYYYGRPYSATEAERYLEGIAEHLTPVYASLPIDEIQQMLRSFTPVTTEEILDRSGTVLEEISAYLGDRFEEMLSHNLCTVTSSENMYYGSFQTYFESYDTPYLFVNGSGTLVDVLTLFHEFGHYTSSYMNYGMMGTNDDAEIASQGLELLATRYLTKAFSTEEAKALSVAGLYSLLLSFNECAAYTTFENLVYSDPNLTLEKCNEYYRTCVETYALQDPSLSGLANGREWVLVNHFFEYPYYIIGYAVAADVVMQLYELETTEEGLGIERYFELIDLAYTYDFFGNLEAVGLQSPFAEGRAEAVAALFERELSAFLIAP